MAENVTAGNVFVSLLAGILPAIFWLWFWLREDSRRPEPRGMILITFIAGMISVVPTYFIQQFIGKAVQFEYALLILWPFAEELAKYLAAHLSALRSKEFDEPIDAIIYLMTSALGFAAAENFFFLMRPEFSILSLLTANMRFVGATLLHLIASGIVGVFIGFSFYKSQIMKKINLILGLFTATILHSLFNLFIIKGQGSNILSVFGVLWLLAVLFILIFEKIKKINR